MAETGTHRGRLRRLIFSSVAASLLAVALSVCDGATVTATAAREAPAAPEALPGTWPSHASNAVTPVLQCSSFDRPTDLTFSSRPPLMAATDGKGNLDVWDAVSWRLLRRMRLAGQGPGKDNAQAIALSPNGATLAVVNQSGAVELRNMTTGALRKTLPGTMIFNVILRWSPDGRAFAASGQTIRIWDTDSGALLRAFPTGGNIAFSTDGRSIAIATYDSVTLHDITGGKTIRSFHDANGVSRPVALSPDGRLLACGGEPPRWKHGPLPTDLRGAPYIASDNFYNAYMKVKVWDVKTGKRLRMLPAGRAFVSRYGNTLAFTSDSRCIVVGGENAIWNARTGARVKNVKDQSTLPWGGRLPSLASYAGDGIIIPNLAGGGPPVRLQQPPLPLDALAFSPDGGTLAAADRTALRLWNVRRGRLDRALPAPPDADVTGVGFLSPNTVWYGALNDSLIVDTASGKVKRTLEGPLIHDEVFGDTQSWQLLAPDGETTVNQNGSPDGTALEVRDWHTRRLLHTLATGSTQMLRARLSPDGLLLATETESKPYTVSVWNLRTGREVSDAEVSEAFDNLFAFSPDDKILATLVQGLGEWQAERRRPPNTLTLTDVMSGRRLRGITLHSRTARALRFSPRGDILAVGADGDVYLLDPGSLSRTAVLPRGDAPVTALAFSPDGKRLAAGDESGRIRLWDVAARKLLVTMVGFPTRDGSKVSPDWFAGTPDGFYAWPDSAAPLIRFRKDGKLYPASAFAKTLRKTDLLGE